MVKKVKRFFVFLFFCLLFSLINGKTARSACFIPKGNCSDDKYQREGTCIDLTASDRAILEDACY